MQETLSITGGRRLEGAVRVSGAKNAALPLLFATLLTPEPCEISNIPDLEDIAVTLRLMRSLGATAEFEGNTVRVATPSITGTEAPYGLVKALRASFWVLGPLIARAGEARVSLPGGDAIGTRPVDLHLRGLERLGAEITMEHGVVIGTAPGGLSASEIDLAFPSVGATHNLLMAAALIPGETVLRGAAREPEVVELCSLLRLMGAEIEGDGTAEIKVRGKKELHGAKYEIRGDRIEAATYLLAGAVTGGAVRVEGISPDTIGATVELLREMGCEVAIDGSSLALTGPERLRAISFKTAPYPGVATDVQPLFMAALTRAEGTSRIDETVFESRLGHAAEYRRFGARIRIEGRRAEIEGTPRLSSAPVEAGDIRAAAGLVLMALMAEGTTTVRDLHHLDRGYERLVEKLCNLGADAARVPAFDEREIVVGC